MIWVMTMTYLTPAQAVAESGFSLDTLRYYEKIGLLDGVERSSSGHRRFTQADLGWLGMLRCLRVTGMPIAEMQRFAELVRAGDHTVADRLALLLDHDEEVEEQITALRSRQAYLRAKIDHYRSVLD